MGQSRRSSTPQRREPRPLLELVSNGGPCAEWWWRLKNHGRVLVSSFQHFQTSRAAYENYARVFAVMTSRRHVPSFYSVEKKVKD